VVESALKRKNLMTDNSYKATVAYAGDEMFIATPPSGHAQVFDVKGDRQAATTPLEALLIAVAGCTAADVISIMLKKRQNVTAYRVEIEGTRADEHPRKFIHFEINHIVYGNNISEKALADAIELSETKYCSVAATVRPTAEVVSRYEIHDA